MKDFESDFWTEAAETAFLEKRKRLHNAAIKAEGYVTPSDDSRKGRHCLNSRISGFFFILNNIFVIIKVHMYSNKDFPSYHFGLNPERAKRVGAELTARCTGNT